MTTSTLDSPTSSTSSRPAELRPTFGAEACRWIEAALIHGEGDRYGEPFRLLPWHKEFLYRWYEYETGTEDDPVWFHNEALIGRERGDVKTEFLAAIAALEMAGPWPFRRLTPIIHVAAAALKQAGELFSQVQIMCGGQGGTVEQAPLLGLFDVWDTTIVAADGSPGRIERVAADAGTIEGGKTTLFLADEVHEWTGRKERVHTVLTAALGKRRNTRSISISTAGAGRGSTPARESDPLLWRLYDRGRRGLDERFLFMWSEMPEGINLDDPDDLRRGLHLTYDPTLTHDPPWSIEDRARMWESKRIPAHEWLRYYANRFVDVGHDGWLSAAEGAWPACEDPDIEGTGPMVAGVDMALRNDSVGVHWVQWNDDRTRLVWRLRNWTADKSGKIDHAEVVDFIRSLHTAHRSDGFRCTYDPRFFELPAQLLEEEGVEMIEFPQSPERMAPACDLAYRYIVDGIVAHDGDPILSDHVLAAVWREGERGRILSKRKSGGHIDGLIAGVMATYEIEAGESEQDDAVPEFFMI